MNAISIGVAVLAFGLTDAPAPGRARSADAPFVPGVRWEYRVLTKGQVLDLGKNDLGAGLNQLGGEGWELAAVDGAYIFKRLRDRHRRTADEVKGAIALAEADVETLKDRVAWAERMARKGYMSARQVEAERLQLNHAQLALDRVRRELGAVPAESKPPAEKPARPEE